MDTMDSNLKQSLGIEEDLTYGLEEERPKEIHKFVLKEIKTRLTDLEASHDLETDYIYSRNLYYTLLELTNGAAINAFHLALNSEQPRAYSTFNELVSTAGRLTSDLLSLQKILKDVKKGNPDFAEKEPIVSNADSIELSTYKGNLSSLLALAKDLQQ